MRTVLWLCLGVVVWPSIGAAHPGRTDACFGHTVKAAYSYACEAEKGTQRCPPSPAGEYHFHRIPYRNQEDIRAHLLEPDAQGRLRLWCEKGDGTRVEGFVRFRDDAGSD